MEQMSTKERIVRAAVDLFSSRGYDSTSMREIARLSKIKAASIYNHFQSKNDILDEILGRYEKIIIKFTTLSEASLNRTKKITADELSELLFYRFPDEVLDHYLKILKVVHHEFIASEKILEFTEKKVIKSSFVANKRILDELILKGLLPPCDTAVMATMIFSVQFAFSALSTYECFEVEKGNEKTNMFGIGRAILQIIVDGNTSTV